MEDVVLSLAGEAVSQGLVRDWEVVKPQNCSWDVYRKRTKRLGKLYIHIDFGTQC